MQWQGVEKTSTNGRMVGGKDGTSRHARQTEEFAGAISMAQHTRRSNSGSFIRSQSMQISTVSDMEAAARKIYAMGCKAIVVKGGHHIGNAVDVLFDGENFYHFETSRIDTKNTHGTGCTFSSAIASQLAKGKSVPLAVESAKAYVTMAIEHSLAIGKGCGPTHHFYELYQHGLSKE